MSYPIARRLVLSYRTTLLSNPFIAHFFFPSYPFTQRFVLLFLLRLPSDSVHHELERRSLINVNIPRKKKTKENQKPTRYRSTPRVVLLSSHPMRCPVLSHDAFVPSFQSILFS